MRRLARADRGALRGLRRPADLRRRPAARPPRHRRLPRRRRTAGSTSSTAGSSRRSSSARRCSTLLPIQPAEDTEGIPGNQFIFEPSAVGGAGAAPAALRRDAPLPGGPRGEGQRGIEPDGRDEERHRERRGAHRGPDPLLQQGPPGQHHPRDDRDRVRRATLADAAGRRRHDNDHGDRRTETATAAGSSRSPDRSSTSSSRPASCRRSTTPSRSSARARSRSSARSSSTSATTGSAPWR